MNDFFMLTLQFSIPLFAGGESQSYCGRVISVKWGDYTRRIGIDGSTDAIKEAIRCAFRLRTKRAFWLEDEDQIIRSLDRDMPLGNYMLHLDEGTIICGFHKGHYDSKYFSRKDHPKKIKVGRQQLLLMGLIITFLFVSPFQELQCCYEIGSF